MGELDNHRTSQLAQIWQDLLEALAEMGKQRVFPLQTDFIGAEVIEEYKSTLDKLKDDK